jgi:hypothetical protein
VSAFSGVPMLANPCVVACRWVCYFFFFGFLVSFFWSRPFAISVYPPPLTIADERRRKQQGIVPLHGCHLEFFMDDNPTH